MVYIKWDRLLQLKKQTNDSPIIKARWPGWKDENGKIDPRPICSQSAKNIYGDFRDVIGDIKENYPDDWKRGFSPEIIQWYEDDQETRQVLPSKGNFVRVPYWFLDDGFLKKGFEDNIAGLTSQEFTVLMVFARHASFTQGVNKHGCRYGETFVSNRKVAEILGMSEASVDRLSASLGKKGHLETIVQEYDGRRNKCIRLVSFMLELREDDGGR